MIRIEIRALADRAIRNQLRIGYDHRRYSHRLAEAVIDAVLPEVNTVEQLEALPVAALLVNESGDDDRRDGWLEQMAADPDGSYLPLTVVWRP